MTLEQKIRDMITGSVARFDGNLLNADTLLMESGLDSLDVATVLLQVQETFDITLPDGSEDQYDTLAKLVEYVRHATA